MSSAPQMPPRPSRSPQPEGNDAMNNVPLIPPRPSRRADRSLSPSRADFGRSPLNEPPVPQNGRAYGHNLSSQDFPKRPSSTFIPSTVGEEGLEYASFDDQAQQSDASSSPKQTRNVAADLPMHAPRASIPQSTASSRIQTVTRTDSSQAAAAGIGQSDAETHPLKARSSFSRSNQHLSYPESAQGTDDEYGPPSMGLQVPMLKYAGDAQAPSAPSSQPATPGGYAQGRNHHRQRSSRHEFGPPGSYGLHGHGLNSFHGRNEPMDQFDRDWYQKHPAEFKREQGRVYDPGHPSHDWALSSDDLNKLVHQSSHRGLKMGTSPEAFGTPSEQIGYLASDEYTSRMNSPRPLSVQGKRLSSGAHPSIESPLRKASVPDIKTGQLKSSDDHDDALESEADDIIHVDPPARRASKVGGSGYDPPTENFGAHGGNTKEEGGWAMENGYDTPILASDEVAKNKDPSAEYMEPAVSPEQERRGSDYYAGWDSEAPGSSQSGRRSSRSRDPTRPGSGHGEPLARMRTKEAVVGSGVGTPLEEIEEYEPLFPDDEQEPSNAKDVHYAKRPDLARHYFPSQDVWEDTPESLQYQTTVDTPQEPEELTASTTFEPPSKEQSRKDDDIPTDPADFLSDEANRMAKPHFKPGVMDDVNRAGHLHHRFPSPDVWEDTPDSLQHQTIVQTPQMPEDLETSTGSLPPRTDDRPKPKFNSDVTDEKQRPELRPRFPSQDIWEDSPDSLRLETTVSGPQLPETSDVLSPESAKSPADAFNKPQLPARPARPSKLAEDSKPAQPDIPARSLQRPRQVPSADVPVPQIPARPSANKAPIMPDRPKPQVPSRPARTLRTESQENAPLSKIVSNASASSAEGASIKSPPDVKAKPTIPARPANANFASLRAGFMSDLNSRLKLGPKEPKKEEEPSEIVEPEEKAPLADARKGRVRGPARRKPAAAAVPAEQELSGGQSTALAMSTTLTVFQVDEGGDVVVPDTSDPDSLVSSAEEVEKNAIANTESAGQTALSGEAATTDAMTNTLSDPVGAEGDSADSAKISSATLEMQKAIEPGFEEALVDSNREGKPPASGSTDVAAAVPAFSSEVPVSGGQEAKDAAADKQRTATAEESTTAEAKPSNMVHQSAQTGEHDILIKSPSGHEENLKITLGGRAPEEGDVVQKAEGGQI